MSNSDDVTFPDALRGELDLALDTLVDKARDVLLAQGRLRALLRANQAVIEHLDLIVVLEKIVAAAVDLVGARYGALGVVAPDGSLEQFINVGMSPEEIAAVGTLPTGQGLLGAVIDNPHPIRLDVLADDARSAGFPARHPPMASFLGVPIRVRNEIYGNLYLTNQKSGRFSEEDEQLVTALAATAGIAIENARLFAETQRRQAWSVAMSEFTSALVSEQYEAALPTLADRVLQICAADVVWMLTPIPDGDDLVIATARGVDEELVQGTVLPIAGSVVAGVLEGHHARQIDDGSQTEVALSDGRRLGPVMAVPLVVAGATHGVLLVGRLERGERFSLADLDMAADFAGQASVAMELAAARADQHRMATLEDRGRIARDLHDHVIQQLFGTGLQLQVVARSLGTSAAADAVAKSVAEIDASISQIRTVIFALSTPVDQAHPSIRHALIDIVNELHTESSTPRLTFSGPVDLVVIADLADDVVAVSREALVNVIKHAAAEHSSIELSVAAGWLTLAITDDGVGIGTPQRQSGILNMKTRAVSRGGSFDLDSDAGETRLRWRVPYEEAR